MATALGRGFVKYGWEVKLGTRTPEKLRAWETDVGDTASVGSFSDAVAFGDVVIPSVRGSAVADVLDMAGPENFGGKLVLDATNPLDFSQEGPPTLLFGGTDSLGERVQATLSDAQVVKCFNTVSNAQMIDPTFEDEPPPMMICGNDDDAKTRTEEILRENEDGRDSDRVRMAERARRRPHRIVTLLGSARPALGPGRGETRHLEPRVHRGPVTGRCCSIAEQPLPDVAVAGRPLSDVAV